MILPPDFTRMDLRSVRKDHAMEDLYRIVAAGIGGASMPQWRGSLPEEDIWAVVYYVKSLVDLKSDGAGLAALRKKLADQPPPPAPPTQPE
jgi:hypothetical protein